MHSPFTYNLPAEKIAQRPVYPYDSAKLLLADTKNQNIKEDSFLNFADYLNSGDLLIFNNSAVIPARIFAELETGAAVEILLLRRISSGQWLCLGKPMKKLIAGKKIKINKDLSAEVVERQGDYEALLKFSTNAGPAGEQEIFAAGCMPIPPYIRQGQGDQKDIEDYQTFFALNQGSVAAPTASLHFTENLFKKISAKNVQIDFLTLHVGKASFTQVFSEAEPDKLVLPGSEEFTVSAELLASIKKTKANGGRVIAVGTTAVRALESSAEKLAGETSLFITPGYKFKVIDAMITNFHQPGTTHLLLVEAFMGGELLQQTYSYALQNDFRFLSYGDGMMIY